MLPVEVSNLVATVRLVVLPRDAMHGADYSLARCPSVRHTPISSIFPTVR